MMTRSLSYLSMAAAAGLLLLAGCSSPEDGATAGITTIGNTVAGTVVDDKGTLVTNAEVRLIDPGYNPSNDIAETGYLVARTDAKGQFSFDKLKPGEYNLEVAKEGLAAFRKGIKLSKDEPADTIPKVELFKPGAITVVFGRAGIKLGGHFFMPGTTRHRRIDTADQRIGSLTLPYVAAGRYASVLYQAPEDSTGGEVLAPRVLDILPEDTVVMIANANWAIVRKVTLNTSSTGANVPGNVLDYPVLVRLAAPAFDFSQVRKDGADLRFAKPDGSPLPYYVSRFDSADGAAEVWVKLDTVYGGSRTQSFYLLAGNADSGSASDVRNVFPSSTGYQGLWNFDAASVLADAVGGNDAINHGAESVDGIIGKALYFRGPAWIDVPAQAFSGVSRKISISFWQKSGDTLQNQPGDVFGGLDAGGNVVLRMHDPFGDSIVYWSAGDSSKLDRLEKKPDAEAANRSRWNYWVMSKDADKGEMKIYLNGKVWAAAIGKTASIGLVRSFVLAFSGTDAYALDEFRISRFAGSDDRVKLSYEIQKAGTLAVLIGK
ncbi:MAG: hypothetical protein JWP91_3434 [Fibrobacteres bacterium]|nr:hypothetical protein [Fibrobacterota bacterium]